MRRRLATLAAATALLAGGLGLTGPTTASAASSVGWCDGAKRISYGGSDFLVQPYHKATGSRNCTLGSGASGAAVTALQSALKHCNEQSSLVVDGEFGPATQRALTNAQRLRGAAADGVYGPETRTKLRWGVHQHSGGIRTCVTYN
ncbi:peptidoglycan-binding domain-containing protein [Streptomyces triticirhizae]|nr:peptidoglycan-binding domain-containing protein [Streptomyces triticirhizae]